MPFLAEIVILKVTVGDVSAAIGDAAKCAGTVSFSNSFSDALKL